MMRDAVAQRMESVDRGIDRCPLLGAEVRENTPEGRSPWCRLVVRSQDVSPETERKLGDHFPWISKVLPLAVACARARSIWSVSFLDVHGILASEYQ